MEWKTLNGGKIQSLEGEILGSIERGQNIIHVGCDSQQKKRFTEFVTVVILLKEGKGGRVLYKKDRVKRIRNLRERLLMEVSHSINTGLEINKISEEIDMNIHIDANPNIKFQSSKYVQQLVGYVMGCGFDNVIVKPDSWAASHVADHVVKSKNL